MVEPFCRSWQMLLTPFNTPPLPLTSSFGPLAVLLDFYGVCLRELECVDQRNVFREFKNLWYNPSPDPSTHLQCPPPTLTSKMAIFNPIGFYRVVLGELECFAQKILKEKFSGLWKL